VHGLEEELGSRMKFIIAPYNEGDAPDRIVRYGLDIHGMVVTDQEDKVHWLESGHAQKQGEVRQVLLELLDG
jgi:hypothetical protein